MLLEVEGAEADLSHFFDRLSAEAPPLARVERVDRRGAGAGVVRAARGRVDEPGFRIVASARAGDPDALIARRRRHLRRLSGRAARPGDRRYPLPVHQLHQLRPAVHDRPRRPVRPAADDDGPVSRCATPAGREYEDPGDRRFHAQPNACPACGPQVAAARRRSAELGDSFRGVGRNRQASGVRSDRRARGAAERGCDRGGQGPRRLSPRLRRGERAGGGGAAGAQAPGGQAVRADGRRRGERAGGWSRSTTPRRRCCARAARPIVLAPRLRGRAVARVGRPGAPELGVMLPYTPLHHLLLSDFAGDALVMTSGNVSDEPIAYRDEDALERLGAIADVFLVHDREIETRTDDSVVRGASRGAAADAAPLPRLRARAADAADRRRRGRCSPAAPSRRRRSVSPAATARGSAITSAIWSTSRR